MREHSAVPPTEEEGPISASDRRAMCAAVNENPADPSWPARSGVGALGVRRVTRSDRRGLESLAERTVLLSFRDTDGRQDHAGFGSTLAVRGG